MAHISGITGIVLAGGRGRRMGGRDKGLLCAGGRPLVAWLCEALAPQVDRLLIVANRNPHLYREYAPVVPDRRPDFQGPLVGVEAGLTAARTPLALVVPCDLPGLPGDLAHRLAQVLMAEDAGLALVDDGERCHPLPVLLRRELLEPITERLDEGVRSLRQGWAGRRRAVLRLDEAGGCFASMNTPEELARLQAGRPQPQADQL